MTLTIYIKDNCETCLSLIQKLEEFELSNSSFEYKTLNLSKTPIAKTIIVPALFVNDQLLAYGEEDIIRITSSGLKKQK